MTPESLLSDVCPSTGAVWTFKDNVISIVLGKDRTVETGLDEKRWIVEHLDDYERRFPGQSWLLAMDFRHASVAQQNTVPTKTMMTWIVNKPNLRALAVINAVHGYEVIIRAIVFALTTETGKLKCFDRTETAMEWLRVKGAVNK